MEDKKESTNWKIAVIYYLIGGLIVPSLAAMAIAAFAGFITSIAIVSGAKYFFLSSLSTKPGIVPVMVILNIFIIWLGVRYCAGYLKKKYIIKDVGSIIKTATIYMIVVNGTWALIDFGLKISKGIQLVDITALFNSVLGIILFYIFSKKYIQNTEIASSQTQQNVNI